MKTWAIDLYGLFRRSGKGLAAAGFTLGVTWIPLVATDDFPQRMPLMWVVGIAAVVLLLTGLLLMVTAGDFESTRKEVEEVEPQPEATRVKGMTFIDCTIDDVGKDAFSLAGPMDIHLVRTRIGRVGRHVLHIRNPGEKPD